MAPVRYARKTVRRLLVLSVLLICFLDIAVCKRSTRRKYVINHSLRKHLDTMDVKRDGTNDRKGARILTSNLADFNFTRKFSGHPMLFFSEEDVTDLRAKAGHTDRDYYNSFIRDHSGTVRDQSRTLLELFDSLSDSGDSRATHRIHMLDLSRAVSDFLSDPDTFLPPPDYEEFARDWNERWGNHLPYLALYCVLQPQDEAAFRFLSRDMIRMSRYRNWRSLPSLKDELPLAHNVAGFAVALDMTYQLHPPEIRDTFVRMLTNQTRDLYISAQKRGWGTHAIIHNHVATNVIGLLIGALVVGVHTTEAVVWQRCAVRRWEESMDVLRHIRDGSMNEGVGYGSYTFSWMCQYVFLTHRHLNVSHFRHPFLSKHFEFYYHTAAPGLRRTVGVADSSRGWFYGPEAHLYFLDTYILRTGGPTWLADRIREQKLKHDWENLKVQQKYPLLHLKFLFYDSSLPSTPPEGWDKPVLHHYDNWGVVTYRSGDVTDARQTFVTFKSSKIHGEAVWDMVHDPSPGAELADWWYFNSGHEHPDQNSFTFLPLGVAFITEQLYSPKLPQLDNVHMFSSQGTPRQGEGVGTRCTPGWAGQVGVCQKWLQYGHTHAKGEVIYAGVEDDVMITVGDSAHAYDESLGLDKLYRSLVLLETDLLLVMDSILLKPDSKLTHVAAFFNNYDNYFRPYTGQGDIVGFSMTSRDGRDFRAIGVTSEGHAPEVSVRNVSVQYLREPVIANANLTFRLEGSRTNIAYLLYREHAQSDLVDLKFVNYSKDGGFVSVSVIVGSKSYVVSIPEFLARDSRVITRVVKKGQEFLFVKKHGNADLKVISSKNQIIVMICAVVIFCFWVNRAQNYRRYITGWKRQILGAVVFVYNRSNIINLIRSKKY